MNNELKAQVGRILAFFSMLEAHHELTDDPLEDTTVVLSFMGSGASDQLTMGDFRKLREAYQNDGTS